MGSLKHPVADTAREAFAARDFQLALDTLSDGLVEDPGNADLACESAILSVYRAQEDQAFELLPIAASGYRFEKLTSLLADFYTSRILADRTDHDARRRLQLVRTFHPKESKHIGVRISACLIVKNEEKTLDRCLKSLAGKVDQIVVVDTGSTDDTVAIANEHGARVAHFEWQDDFSEARNFALSFATGNWILCIDADEELTPETKFALERAVIRPQFGGFDIDIVNFMDDLSQREQFHHCPTRLFRNLPGICYSGRIHEQVNPALIALGLPWARLEGATILHHGYRPEVMQEKMKVDRTISLLEREVREDASNAFQWFNLANAYLVGNRASDAASAAKNAVQSLTPTSGVATHAYSVLIQALRAIGEFDEAIAYADQAISRGLDCLQIAFEKCGVLVSAGRFPEALVQADHMMVMEWPQGSVGDVGILTHKRFVLRAQILANLDRYEDALTSLDRALEAAPGYGPTHFVRAQIMEKLKQADRAIDAYLSAAKDPMSFRDAMLSVTRLYAARNQFERAAHTCFQVWIKDTTQLPVWLEWKRMCESSGNLLLVLECYEQFAALQKMSAEMFVDWGRALAAAGKHPQAIKCFADAMNLEPTHANAYFNCGDVLYSSGMADRAAEIFRAGLTLRPDFADGWFVFGNALAKIDHSAEAIQAFERVLELAPNHEKALHNLSALKVA